MVIKKLMKDEISEIYKEHLVYDFPKDEVKPLERILEMGPDNMYFCYGLFQDDELLGYAYFVGNEDSRFILLDYFAVVRGRRSAGLGSQFISLLGTKFKNVGGIILESENDVFAKDENDLMIRQKRLGFYEKNGLKDTKITSRLFGVEYKILYLPCNEEADKDVVLQGVEDIYKYMFYPKYVQQYLVRRE